MEERAAFSRAAVTTTSVVSFAAVGEAALGVISPRRTSPVPATVPVVPPALTWLACGAPGST